MKKRKGLLPGWLVPLAFVTLCGYLFFLLILGLPIMVMEFAVGRASQKSAALSFDVLEPKGTKWHLYKYGAMAPN